MCVAGVDGTEVTGRMVAVQVVLGPDGIEGMLRPSTFPEVGALRGGDDPEPTWCSRRWLHPLILSETGPPEAVRAGGRAGVVTSSCRRAGFASHRLPSGSRRAGPQSRSGEVIGSSPAPEPLRDVSRAFPKPSHSAARLTGMGRATPAVSLVSRVLKSYWAGQDRRRRRRVRDAARRLVPEKAWSGEKATAPELACLTLLHLLWLQDQTRRAARVRNTEGAALLARSAVETVIAGLYCLNVPGAAKRYDAGAGKDLKKLFAQFTKAADVGTEVLDDMLAFLGPGGLPLPATMVSDIAANSGPAAAQDLYRRYYVPLSAMYAQGPIGRVRGLSRCGAADRRRTPPTRWSDSSRRPSRGLSTPTTGCSASTTRPIGRSPGRRPSLSCGILHSGERASDTYQGWLCELEPCVRNGCGESASMKPKLRN